MKTVSVDLIDVVVSPVSSFVVVIWVVGLSLIRQIVREMVVCWWAGAVGWEPV